MGLTNDERSSLVALRLYKANRFFKEAEQMLSMEPWDLAARSLASSFAPVIEPSSGSIVSFISKGCQSSSSSSEPIPL